MSDAEEETTALQITDSETIWPVDEEWLCRIIKQNNQENPDIDVTIKVCVYAQFLFRKLLSFRFRLLYFVMDLMCTTFVEFGHFSFLRLLRSSEKM